MRIEVADMEWGKGAVIQKCWITMVVVGVEGLFDEDLVKYASERVD